MMSQAFGGILAECAKLLECLEELVRLWPNTLTEAQLAQVQHLGTIIETCTILLEVQGQEHLLETMAMVSRPLRDLASMHVGAWGTMPEEENMKNSS